MYYLDLTEYYIRTSKEQRIKVRKSLNRDKEMSYKLNLQRNCCFWCGDEIDMSGHLDHVMPIYRGGTNASSNLVASCRRCNLTKGADIIEITNQNTINDYLKLQEAYRKWMGMPKELRRKKQSPRRVKLYGTYSARLFKKI